MCVRDFGLVVPSRIMLISYRFRNVVLFCKIHPQWGIGPIVMPYIYWINEKVNTCVSLCSMSAGNDLIFLVRCLSCLGSKLSGKRVGRPVGLKFAAAPIREVYAKQKKIVKQI